MTGQPPRGISLYAAVAAASFVLVGTAATAEPVTVRIRMLEGLRFDPPRFRVDAGLELRLELVNADSTDLAHNLLVLDSREARQEIVDAALALGPQGPDAAYVPESNHILAASRLLQAGDRQTLVLRMPQETGVLPYVCTFPGHGQIMYGAIHVGKDLPELAADADLPDLLRREEGGVISRRPWVQRMFLPDAGPAAVAVALRGVALNVCWDAGTCSLRYVWEGAFLDCGKHWNSKGQPRAELLGEVIWKTADGSRIRAGSGLDPPEVRFRGYELIAGEPQFHYEIDGVAIRETLAGDLETGGLRRTFSIEKPGGPIWLGLPETAGFRREASAGQWNEKGLSVPEQNAETFSVLLIPEPGT
ncbi:MAG TPA: plastocyanin/azurin family copper-binding protein [Verrucomicrobiales bacterium]|nr:plastocyanin/azurin family copper-binding protein [Verrucomicrobiales bacterium]